MTPRGLSAVINQSVDDYGDMLASLLTEWRFLVDAIIGYSGENNTVKSLGQWLLVNAPRSPWIRMYQEFPEWQEQSGLLKHSLNKNAVDDGSIMVFNTLIKPRSRTDLGGETSWDNKGAKEMGSQMFDTNKLYHREGFTVIEFVQKTNQRQQQARVAICVLHRRDNRHVNEHLVKGYLCPEAYGGINSGATQENLHILVQGDPVVDGLTHIPQFGSTINQASCNEVAHGIYPGAIQASLPMDVQPELPIYSAFTVGELGNGPHFSDTIGQLTSTSEGGGYHRFPANFLMNPSTLIFATDANTYDNTWASTVATVHLDANAYDNKWESNVATSVGYHAAHAMIPPPTLCINAGMQNTTMDAMNFAYNPALNYGMNIPAWYMNGSMSDMPMSDSSTISFGNSIDPIMPNQYATLPEQDALTDQNDSSITYSFGNSMGTPNENAMTSENEPLRRNYFEDDHFSFPEFWEPNSTFETNDNEPLLEHFAPAEYCSAPTGNNTHNCPLDEFHQFCDFF